jgi:hypothetical protein
LKSAQAADWEEAIRVEIQALLDHDGYRGASLLYSYWRSDRACEGGAEAEA